MCASTKQSSTQDPAARDQGSRMTEVCRTVVPSSVRRVDVAAVGGANTDEPASGGRTRLPRSSTITSIGAVSTFVVQCTYDLEPASTPSLHRTCRRAVRVEVAARRDWTPVDVAARRA
jgi:hypothetical protein